MFLFVSKADSSWISHKGKKYLFVMDAARRQDLNYNDAKRRCFELGSALVTVDTEEEFDFLKEEIRRRVIHSGQEFAHEQWWTAGRVSGNSWVWERPNRPSGKRSISFSLTLSVSLYPSHSLFPKPHPLLSLHSSFTPNLKHCSSTNSILIHPLLPTFLLVSIPNTIYHSRLTVCLPDSLDLIRCLSILFWPSACE